MLKNLNKKSLKVFAAAVIIKNHSRSSQQQSS